MANYDAKIRIGTDIDTSKLKSLQIQMNKAVDKAAALADKMNKLKDQHIPTKEYTDLQNELTKAEKHADSLYGKLRVMESSGKVNTEGYEKLKVQVKYADSEIQHLRNSMDELEKSGGAFTLGADTDAYQKLSAQYRDANAQVSLLAAKQEEVINKNKRTSASGEAISDAFKKVYSSATKSFRALISGGKKSNSLLSTMKSRMSGLALSLLIFNQISKGFNSSVNGMKEGFQNLARYSDETNQVMSEFKGELETTKNSLAVAFEPLALTVIPYFTQFLGVLNSACNSLAWFMAIVSGKNTYKKATNQMVDYADSLNNAGSAARNALAAFDELNVLSKPEAGSGSTSPEDMFEEVETGVPDDWTAGLVDAINMGDWEEAGKLLAEKLNEAAGEIDYTKIGATIGKGLTNAFAAGNGFLSNVDTLSIGAGFATMLNKAMEELDEELVGKTAAETINRIFDAAFGFLSTFDFKAAGLELSGIINGFFANIDFGEAGENVSLLAEGILQFFESAVEEVEWDLVGEKIGEFFKNIDWFDILKGAGDLVEDAIKGVFRTAVGFAKGLFSSEEETVSLADELTMEIQANYQEVLNEFEALKDIADEYYSMSQNYDSLTDEQKQKVEEYAELLSEKLGIAKESIDGVTGAYTGTRDSLDKLIESTESYYAVLSAQDTLLRLYTDRTEAEIKAKEATDSFATSLDAWAQVWGVNKQFYFGEGESLEEMALALIEYIEMLDSYTGPMSDYRDTLNELYDDSVVNAIEKSYEYAKAMQEQQGVIDVANEQILYAQAIVDSYSESVVVAGGTMSNSWATGTTALKRHVDETQTSMSTMSNSWATGTTAIKRTATESEAAVSDIVTAWQNGEVDVCTAVDAMMTGMNMSFDTAYEELLIKTKAFIEELHHMYDDYTVGVSGLAIGGTFVAESIPQLATGGIAVNSTLANIGEAGKEAVLPLENNTEWMDMLADRIGTDRPVVINFEGNLAQLGRVLKPVIDAENRRVGHSFLKN